VDDLAFILRSLKPPITRSSKGANRQRTSQFCMRCWLQPSVHSQHTQKNSYCWQVGHPNPSAYWCRDIQACPRVLSSWEALLSKTPPPV
jgi:hypothetical protein